MTKTEIKPLLIQGKKIRRASWLPGKFIMAVRPDRIETESGDVWDEYKGRKLCSTQEVFNSKPVPRQTDWEEYK